jgi:hypothetical protein
MWCALYIRCALSIHQKKCRESLGCALYIGARYLPENTVFNISPIFLFNPPVPNIQCQNDAVNVYRLISKAVPKHIIHTKWCNFMECGFNGVHCDCDYLVMNFNNLKHFVYVCKCSSCRVINYWTNDKNGYYCSSKIGVLLATRYQNL